MIPQPDNNITVWFKNGIQLEGIVVSWSDKKSILKSGLSTLVIQNCAEDILFYKFNNVLTEYEIVKEKPIKTHDDIEDIAALKNELNLLEREEIANKLKSHSISEPRAVQYGKLPISIINNSARKKVSGSNTSFDTELQDMFSKK